MMISGPYLDGIRASWDCGIAIEIASPAEYPYTEVEREFVARRFEGQAPGSPETVEAQLTELLGTHKADELILTRMIYDIEDRIRSFKAITKMATRMAARPGRRPLLL